MASEREERDARIHALRDKARADVQDALTCIGKIVVEGFEVYPIGHRLRLKEAMSRLIDVREDLSW